MTETTFSALCSLFYEHNEKNNITHQFSDEHPLIGRIVFANGPWLNKEYSENDRSYDFRSDNKAFISGLGGNSIFGNCLDGIDMCVRLDLLMENGWQIEKCYLLSPDDKEKHD